MRHAVRPRGQDGTRSMKVTIPADVCRRHGIEDGDVFWVEVDDDDALVLKFVRTSTEDEAQKRARAAV